jgi:hypothetical protein
LVVDQIDHTVRKEIKEGIGWNFALPKGSHLKIIKWWCAEAENGGGKVLTQR